MRRVALSVPGYVEPMLPTLIESPPEGDDWVHEIKYDGYRTIVAVDGVDTRAFTRNGHDWSAKYNMIVHQAAGLRCDTAILDGEMIVQNQDGVSDFGALRSAITAAPQRLILYAFDLMMLNGKDLLGLALTGQLPPKPADQGQGVMADDMAHIPSALGSFVAPGGISHWVVGGRHHRWGRALHPQWSMKRSVRLTTKTLIACLAVSSGDIGFVI